MAFHENMYMFVNPFLTVILYVRFVLEKISLLYVYSTHTRSHTYVLQLSVSGRQF